MRDLQADKAICEKATPGPWEIDVLYMAAGVNDGSHKNWAAPKSIKWGECALCNTKLIRSYKEANGESVHMHKIEIDEESWHDIYSAQGVEITGNYDCEEGGVSSTREDAEFIVAAREGWPEAIERAIAAEAKLAKMRSRIAQLYKDWHIYVPCRCEFYISGAVKCGGCIVRESLAELDKKD